MTPELTLADELYEWAWELLGEGDERRAAVAESLRDRAAAQARRLAEAERERDALRVPAARYEALVEAVNGGAIISRARLGLYRAEFVDENDRIFRSVHEESFRSLADALRAAAEAAGPEVKS